MLKVISTIFAGFIMLVSCDVDLPERELDCFLDVDQRSNGGFQIRLDSIPDTTGIFFTKFDTHGFLISSKIRNDDGSYNTTISIQQADSVSRLFFIANPNTVSCISQVTKGDTLGADYLQKSGLHGTGRSWCNDCETLLFSATDDQIDCGPPLKTVVKAPFSIETGDGANYGWFEFLISEHNFFLLKTNIAKHCDEVVVR